MQILDGKKTSEDIKSEIAAEVQRMKADGKKCLIWRQLLLEPTEPV